MNDFPTFETINTPQRQLLERDIQAACVRFARSRGTYARKFVSTANRSVPDYLMITMGWIWFVEFKKRGGKLTAGQEEEHTLMRKAGGEVYVFNDIEEFKKVHATIEERGWHPAA